MSDQVRHDCCFLNYEDIKEETDDNTSNEEDDLEEAPDYEMTSCGDHDCSHKCEMRNGLPTCVCGERFHLAIDEKTCVTGIAEPITQDNCDEGFRMDYAGDCEDIDECVEATHSCQESEICVNTFGSFVCEFDEDCEEGFNFSKDTKKCEGL